MCWHISKVVVVSPFQSSLCCALTTNAYWEWKMLSTSHWLELSVQAKFPAMLKTYIFWTAMTPIFSWDLPQKTNYSPHKTCFDQTPKYAVKFRLKTFRKKKSRHRRICKNILKYLCYKSNKTYYLEHAEMKEFWKPTVSR